jgi:hypothetical protein
VAVAEQSDEQAIDEVALTNYDARDFIPDGVDEA